VAFTNTNPFGSATCFRFFFAAAVLACRFAILYLNQMLN
jgi:hypothetical protein